LIGEPAAFRRPDELQRLLGVSGIRGTVVEQGRMTYVFVGSTERGDEDA
jgi:hypothetical protein